ncbi:MAG: PH domain-containing protein [Chloroflexi bacterium]|nr:PH domain-containing protein [Chloroflexota bacterium]
MDANVFVPSDRLKIKYYLWVWITFVVFILPFVLLGFASGLGWGFVAFFLFANAIWIVIAHLLIAPYYRSISYELGEEDIIVRKGIITKTETMVPYRMVTNVSVKRGPMDRLLGMGTLEVHTAGYSQQAKAEADLPGRWSMRWCGSV